MRELAKAYLDEAEDRLKIAENSFQSSKWSLCIRASQECVELSLKAVLRLIGIEYPKEHDVSKVLMIEQHRFPKEFSSLVDELASISRSLAKLRGPSVYGDEVRGIPAISLFTDKDAKYALDGAKKVFDACMKLYVLYD